MQLTDTHCHIHSTDYKLNPDEVIQAAAAAGVTRLICVGTDVEDSQLAVAFVQQRDACWASIGIHPHEAKRYVGDTAALEIFAGLAEKHKIIAIGEAGLDYHYNHSPKKEQQQILRFQLELARRHNLPVIFHVREAFGDFWPIYDEYRPNGVLHSFTASTAVLEEALKRGLYIGLNGIMTFTKEYDQLEMAKAVPLEKLLLETDAPYLTPAPYRGTICESKHVRTTAEFLSGLRGESLEDLAVSTTGNAVRLFGL
jgi:TatD DNase family protein